MSIYNDLIYRPIFNLLVYLYNIIPGHDLGIAIIVLTILIKLLLNPLSKKSIKAQKELQEIQPLMNEIKQKYKDDKLKMNQEMMALYKKHNVNPVGSCLPLLIQLPFLIAVYNVFMHGLKDGSLDQLYSFVPNPGALNPISLGIIDLSKPIIILAILVGALQFVQTKMMIHTRQPKVEGSKDEQMMADLNKQMMYVMPAITVFISITLPSGLALYWLTNTILTIIQQKSILSTHQSITSSSKIIEGEKIEK